MRSLVFPLALLFVCSFMWTSVAAETSTDRYIKELGSKDPETRANAAYELGCS